MGVDVDEAWRDELAARVDFLRASAGELANSGDPAVLHRDIGLDHRAAKAVGDRTVADHEIIFGCHGISPVVWFCSVDRTVCL